MSDAGSPPRSDQTWTGVFIEIPIAWGEMDALGHVNNVAYFRYLESARVEFLRRCGHERLHPPRGVGFILQSVQARFRRPLFFPDVVRVTARLAGVLEDRFTLAHEIISTTRNEVAAVGEGVIVAYDYDAGRKANLSEEFRRAAQAASGSAR